ncbi:CYTH domain-containing protein [Neorhizobium sp. BT27B]|uniref:CYTH domain-containing protein n=1 Tax=Neorhizobium sp. BT27B TaxID=3142625 RepID=UPI003D276094
MSEVELKLEIDAGDLDRLLQADQFGGQGEVVQQHSTYFDTGDNVLFSSGFTLRIRQAGDTHIQTIKATGPSASIFARSEWEMASQATIQSLIIPARFSMSSEIRFGKSCPNSTSSTNGGYGQ